MRCARPCSAPPPHERSSWGPRSATPQAKLVGTPVRHPTSKACGDPGPLVAAIAALMADNVGVERMPARLVTSPGCREGDDLTESPGAERGAGIHNVRDIGLLPV